MAELSRADIIKKLELIVLTNNRRLVSAAKLQLILKDFIASFANITDDEVGGSGVNADWDAVSGLAQILNKPSTFPPTSHGHSISDVSGLATVLSALLTDSAPENTIKGRITAGTGVIEDLSVAQVTALLNIFSNTLQGLVPLSGGGVINFLRADQSWANPLPSVQEVGGTSTVTTTSLTNVLLTGMTITPGAGTYLAFFSCTGYNNGTPAGYIEASLFVNSTQVATSIRKNTNGGNHNASLLEGVLAFQEKITVLVGEVVEVKWLVNGATGTIKTRKLTLMPCQ